MNSQTGRIVEGDARVTPIEYLSYGGVDFAQISLVQFVTIYVLYYYTDLSSLSAAFVGSVFFFSRIWDGVNDPLMGLLVDRTHTKRGRCIPYLLPAGLVLALATVALFSAPEGFEGLALGLYFILVYNIFNMAFTALNLPLTAMLPLMTRHPRDRDRLSATRAFSQAVAYTLVPIFAERLVLGFGGHQQPSAYASSALLLAVVGVVLIAIAIVRLSERVRAQPENVPWRELKPIFHRNWPWLIVLTVNVLISSALIARVTSAVHYFKWVVGDLRWLGLTLSLTTIAMMVVALLAPTLSARWGKARFAAYGCALASIGYGIMLLWPETALALLPGAFISGAALGAFISVLFAMEGEIADEVYSRTGIHAQGLVCSAVALGYKLALGLGAGLVGWLLAASGYDPSAAQANESSRQALLFTFTGFPLLATLLSIPLLLRYRIEIDRTAAASN